MYYSRITYGFLSSWKVKSDRKPLIVRGARQVGKSFLIEEFGRREFENLVVVDFEKESSMRRLFAAEEEVSRVLKQLEMVKNVPIRPGKTLLFLDEIQACPSAISKLRYFYEDLPEYHVISAGSLLEFTLEQEIKSFPVGRVEFVYMFPFVFEEYLDAIGEARLVEFIHGIEPRSSIPETVAEKLRRLFRDYLIVGGMPELVKKFATASGMKEVQNAAEGLIRTLEEDFRKYRTRFDPHHLEFIFNEVPKWLGQQVNYSKMGQSLITAQQISKGVGLLQKAMLVTMANAVTSAQFPLASRGKTHPKLFYLDVGLAQFRSRITREIMEAVSISSVYKGGLAEQFAAQEILALTGQTTKPELFFWVSENRTSNADVDFILPHGSHAIPVEVKSGKGTTLASLHRFNSLYKPPLSVRIYDGNLSLEKISVKLSSGGDVSYLLLSIPHFLIRQLPRLIDLALTPR